MPSLRMMPKVMTLTDAAAARVAALIAQKPGVKALKIGIKKGGCAGMEYTMTWADQIGKFDEVIEDKGAIVLIDPAAIMYLLGTEMDFKTSTTRTRKAPVDAARASISNRRQRCRRASRQLIVNKPLDLMFSEAPLFQRRLMFLQFF